MKNTLLICEGDKVSDMTNKFDADKNSFKNLLAFFNDFNNFFENDFVDTMIKQEFSREYALLPLLVKAQMYSER